jgi:hypothetical protein
MTAGGFYHCSVKSVGRAKGRSVVAAAAYRSGQRLEDARTGEIFDYRARGGVVDTFIIASQNAPAWAHDRAQLWSRAELAEGRANGRLATELELALPHELTPAARKQLLHDFLASIIERHDTVADVAIHEPGDGKDHRNVHAHVLFSHRMLDARGFIEKEKGQRKDAGLSNFAMGSEAVIEIRKEWEQHVNRAYERAGLDIHVDHRSHKERGIEQEPTKHLGPSANAMEQREPGSSDRGDINRDIEERNKALRDRAALEIEAIKAAAEFAALHMLVEMERTGAVPIYEIDFPDDSSRKPKKKAHADMDDDVIAKQREQRQQTQDRQATIFNEMVADRNRADRFLSEWQIAHEQGERNKRHLQEAQWRREAEGDITDVRARATIAAGESRDFVQALRREGAMITQEHAELQREIALEKGPDKKQLLVLKRDIQHADYMALANERIAAMSNLNGEQYKDAMRQQEAWAKTGTELRRERRELQEHMADREMETLNRAVERMETAKQQNQADARADTGGMSAPESARSVDPTKAMPEAAQAHDAARPSLAPGLADKPSSEAERVIASEIIYSSSKRPEPERPAASRDEITDARQAKNDHAGQEEITDSKAAKKAALAQLRTETEQAIERGHDRGRGHSR